ncbi:hypothetical protein [Pararhodobacter sp.]|uniref:hypothetical protein n=1 Tax=Pararhodobacter sp. TaxID=2127056 RepID=UPI002FDE4D8D
MRGDPETRVQFATLVVALQARFEQLPEEDVEQLHAFACNALPEANPTRRMVEDFAARWQEVRRNPDERAKLARELHNQLIRCSHRPPPDMERRDIYG